MPEHFSWSGGKTLGAAVYRTDEDNNHNEAITSEFLNSLGTPMPRSAETSPDLFWESVPRQKILDFIKVKLRSVMNSNIIWNWVLVSLVNLLILEPYLIGTSLSRMELAKVMSPNSLLADIELLSLEEIVER